MEKPIQQTRITSAQLRTITGSTLGIWVICFLCSNILGDSLSPKGLKILAAFLSVVFSFRFVSPVKSWLLNDIITGIVNAGLLFITASGVNIIAATTIFAPSEALNPTQKKEIVDSLKVNKGSILPFLRETAWWQDKALVRKVENLTQSVTTLKSINTKLEKHVKMLEAVSGSGVSYSSESLVPSSSISGNEDEETFSAKSRAASERALQEHNARVMQLAIRIKQQEARVKTLDSLIASKSKVVSHDFDFEGINECIKKVRELEARIKLITTLKSEAPALQLSKTGDSTSMKLSVKNCGDNALKINNVTYTVNGAEYSSSKKTALINEVFTDPQTNTSFVMRPLISAERTLAPKESKVIFYMGLAPSTVGKNISKVKFSIRIDYEDMSGRQYNYTQVITPTPSGGN